MLGHLMAPGREVTCIKGGPAERPIQFGGVSTLQSLVHSGKSIEVGRSELPGSVCIPTTGSRSLGGQNGRLSLGTCLFPTVLSQPNLGLQVIWLKIWGA